MSEGRWPANVILSSAMAEVLDKQSGISKDGKAVKRNRDGKPQGVSSWALPGDPMPDQTYGGQGGASRFFLTAGYEPWELEWIIANGLTPCGT